MKKPKGLSNIKVFIENQLHVKTNQIHEFIILLSYAILDSSADYSNKKYRSIITLLD